VDVDERQAVEQRRRDDSPIGDDDGEVGIDLLDVAELVGHGQVELDRRGLDRRRHQPRAVAAGVRMTSSHLLVSCGRQAASG